MATATGRAAGSPPLPPGSAQTRPDGHRPHHSSEKRQAGGSPTTDGAGPSLTCSEAMTHRTADGAHADGISRLIHSSVESVSQGHVQVLAFCAMAWGRGDRVFPCPREEKIPCIPGRGSVPHAW